MGEDSTDDLQELEDELAEEYAAEDGGTGLSFYNEDGYDYDASNPLTDVDYQYGDNESSLYTNNNTGTEAFDPVGRAIDDDEQEGDGNGNGSGVSGASVGGGYGAANDDWNGEDNDGQDGDADSGEDEEDDNEDGEEDEDDEDEDGVVQGVGAARSQASKRNDYDGAIKWKPGQPITVKLLSQTWPECRKINKIHNLVEMANEQVTQTLSALTKGPNLTFKGNNWIQKLFDQSADMISGLISLATSAPKRWIGIAVSTAKAILFDQQVVEALTVATLPEVFEGLLATELKPIMDKIHKVAVPIINRKYQKRSK